MDHQGAIDSMSTSYQISTCGLGWAILFGYIVRRYCQYHAPIMVFLGAVLGLGLVSALGVAIGGKLQTMVPMDKLRIGSGILFLVFGVLFLLRG
ncbi:MAG: TMEM165/GDT1 family protein [ANME-2 cluster archaeon]|nr:TMEM165/GDT1 family protein [ANME-2 cluster archaeon]MBC2747976.1 TMEM165/GDT1 family protein [ANME-2 cluster archaeon]